MSYLPERDLLILLLEKEAYAAYYEYIDKSYLKDNYRELSYLYLTLEEAHAVTQDNLSLDSLQAFFFQKYPDADKEMYLALFKTLSETQIDKALGVHMLKQIKQRKDALELSEAYFKFSNGNTTIEQLSDLVNRRNVLDEAETNGGEFEFVTTDLSSIIQGIFQKSGLRWRLDALNKSLGSLRKGNFGFLFARPETGKTTFLTSEISHMLTQLKDEDGPIIWFNNEQVGVCLLYTSDAADE